MQVFRSWLFGSPGRLFGYSHDCVMLKDGTRYLERWILWFGIGTLRLHRFWSGDDLRAPHDHPWWFITFPLRSYEERVFDKYSLPDKWRNSWPDMCPPDKRNFCRLAVKRTVRAFRFHYRPAGYRHIVLQPSRPVFTIVITGARRHHWGFWPRPHTFVHHTEWE